MALAASHFAPSILKSSLLPLLCLCREALGAVRDFGAALEAAPVPQLPRDLPPPHPVWGAMTPPQSNAARQALLVMLLSAGGLAVGGERSCSHLFKAYLMRLLQCPTALTPCAQGPSHAST